jgi:hypothetical protein
MCKSTVAIVNGSKKHNSVGAGSPTIIAKNPQSHKPAPAPPSIPIYLFQNNYKNLEGGFI